MIDTKNTQFVRGLVEDPDNIMVCYRGSIAHNMHCPDPDSIDDIDLLVCTIGKLSSYLGIKNSYERGKELKEGRYDVVVYDLRHFINLLAKGNPNVMATLWMYPEYYLKLTPLMQRLIDNRGLFVGKHIYDSFVGYAKSQMHKMKGAHDNVEYLGYMGAKRKALFDKYGYDCKNAAHLIRLLRMCCEFLDTGEMIVNRPDKDELLNIKNGGWGIDQVFTEAKRLFQLAEEKLQSSTLPDGPRINEIDGLCTSLIATHLLKTGEIWS